jgi:S1-C subfamily serine protease
MREGHERTLEAELDQAENTETAARAPATPSPQSSFDPAFDGVELAAADRSKPNSGGASGLSVVSVEEGCPADIQGLRAGDVITHINRQRVRSLEDARRILKDARSVVLQVQRGSRGLLLILR